MDTVQLLCGEAIVFFTPTKVPGTGPVLRPSVHVTPGPSTNALGRKERRGRREGKGEEEGGRKMMTGRGGWRRRESRERRKVKEDEGERERACPFEEIPQ